MNRAATTTTSNSNSTTTTATATATATATMTIPATKPAGKQMGATQAQHDAQRRWEVALIKVAVSEAGDTKKALITAIRAAGFPGNPMNVARVQELRGQFESTRWNRCVNRANARTTMSITTLPAPSGRPAIRLPPSTPRTRLKFFRQRVVAEYAQQAFRFDAPGGYDFTVKFAAQTGEVDYSVSLGRAYDVYGGAYKGWGANIANHTIHVPLDWRRRVERKGIALLGGMLTLDALPMEAPAGIELYSAVWARQGRGYDVNTERGVIALGGGESFHGDTVEKAIAGLRRKVKFSAATGPTNADMKSAVEEFISKYSRFTIDVSLDDARISGSCENGIRSWCESVAIDIGRLKVPMGELLDGFRRMPLTEVRHAVLHAVRQRHSFSRG